MNSWEGFKFCDLGGQTQMTLCVCGGSTAQYLRERLEVCRLTLNHISTTGIEDKRNLLSQFLHWPNEDNDTTYSKGLFSILNKMINIDIYYQAPSNY